MHSAPGSPVTVTIVRAVRKQNHDQFEVALKRFIPQSLRFPGHLGVHMVRPAKGGNHFGAVLTFQSQQDWEDFQKWSEYRAFLSEIEPYLEASPHVEALTGLESWFTPFGSDILATPPRWKVALVTWIGVCFTVYVVNSVFAAVVPSWPRFASFLLANAVIVAGLTWAVMPVLTWIFRGWLIQRDLRVTDQIN